MAKKEINEYELKTDFILQIVTWGETNIILIKSCTYMYV